MQRVFSSAIIVVFFVALLPMKAVAQGAPSPVVMPTGDPLTRQFQTRGIVPCTPLVTLGACLDDLQHAVEQALNKIQDTGVALEVGAGNQIALNIANARIAFQTELQTTMSTVSGAATQFVGSTSSQIAAIENTTNQDLRGILDQIEETAQRIPFVSHAPALRKIDNPYFVGPAPDAQLQPSDVLKLSFTGSFYDVGNGDMKATLRLSNGHYYQNTANTNTSLGFDIPLTELRRSQVTNKPQFVHTTLSVPFKKTGFCIWHCKDYKEFGVDLISVPSSPGTLTVVRQAVVPITNMQETTSGEIFQSSANDDVTEDKTGKLYCSAPDPGWQVMTSTVTGYITNVVEDGPYWWTGNPASETGPAGACVRLETIHHRVGSSGQVKFRIAFCEQQPGTQHNIHTDGPYQLAWGQPQAITLNAGETWSATFQQFDGKTYSFNSSNVGTPFLRVDWNVSQLQFTPTTVVASASQRGADRGHCPPQSFETRSFSIPKP